jgi:hypothetical protein
MPVQTRSKTIYSTTIDSKTLKKETKKEIKKRKKQFTRERKSNQLQKNPIEYQEDQEDQEDHILVPKRLAKQVAQIQYHFEDRSVIFELDWDGEKALFTHNNTNRTFLFNDMTLRQFLGQIFQATHLQDYSELDILISKAPLCQINIH